MRTPHPRISRRLFFSFEGGPRTFCEPFIASGRGRFWKYLVGLLLPILTFPTVALGHPKEYPLTLTVWRTDAAFRKPDGTVIICTLLGDQPDCPTNNALQTFIEFVSYATVADGKIYVIKCVSRIRRAVDLDDPVRLGIVPPGDYKARWDKGKLKALFFGKNRQWNELTFVIKASYPETPELKHKYEGK